MTNEKQNRRRTLYSLLGELPSEFGTDRPSVSARTISTTERDGCIVENLILDLNGIEPVPAYFLKPADADLPAPVVLFNHSHGGNYALGKDEIFKKKSALPSYAEEFARLGVCALSIDHWCFGERSGRTESETFKQMLWEGRTMWGMMVFDSLRAIDYLATRRDVSPAAIGTLGMSMGSTMAWWAAALDERIKVCVDLYCLTDYHALQEARGLDGHGIYYYVPKLLKHFTTAQINALIAPRPHLGIAGNYDNLTPPAGLDRIDAELRQVYEQEGAPDAWKMIRYNVGHRETIAARAAWISFLQKWL